MYTTNTPIPTINEKQQTINKPIDTITSRGIMVPVTNKSS